VWFNHNYCHEESSEDTALQQLHYIANAVQRYEMVRNRKVSNYSEISLNRNLKDLGKLKGLFLKNVEPDPWGNIYTIDLEHGLICSQGPNFIPSSRCLCNQTFFGCLRKPEDCTFNPISREERLKFGTDDIVVYFRDPTPESEKFLSELLKENYVSSSENPL
jgi:hypothetical protein